FNATEIYALLTTLQLLSNLQPILRGDLSIEQARLQIAEELQGRQQRVDLGRIEPEARKLIARTVAGLAEAIAIAGANILDRRMKAVAHVDQVALERCPRHPQRVLESGKRHDLAVLQQLVDLVESFRPIHRGRRAREPRQVLHPCANDL